MRSIARFRAVILWACSRFFPSAPGFTAVSLDGSSFFSLIFFFYFYLYIIIMFYYLHRGVSSTFTFLFFFSFFFLFFLGFIWRGGRLIYIWGGLPGQEGQWTQWI